MKDLCRSNSVLKSDAVVPEKLNELLTGQIPGGKLPRNTTVIRWKPLVSGELRKQNAEVFFLHNGFSFLNRGHFLE